MGKVLVAFLAFGMPLLTACSGGGGSGAATVTPPASVATTQVPKTSGIAVNLQAPATAVTYQAAAVTAIGASKGLSNISSSAAGQGATITLVTDANGNLSHVGIPAGGIDLAVSGDGSTGRSLTSPSTLDFYYQLQDVFYSSSIYFTSDDIGYSISQVAAGQGLTASAYGIWASDLRGAFADAGVFAFGNLTPTASVPTTGSATFNGFTTGMGGAINGSAAFVLKGNAQVIANFTNQSVTTNLTNFDATNLSFSSTIKASVPDLTGTSSITGSAYAGTIAGGGLAGTINGNFYGSAAQETAGVWQASGGGNSWIGSFGAK